MLVVPVAILLGSVLGAAVPSSAGVLGAWVDPTVLVLVTLLFFEVRVDAGYLRSVFADRARLRFLSVAWIANVAVVPTLGFGIASLFLSGEPLLFTGVVIYLMAPCTDWFLGFTRAARGDTALGLALVPVNMVSQLLLYPVFLALFVGAAVHTDPATVAGTVAQWFLLPLVVAVTAHHVLRRVLPVPCRESLRARAGGAVPYVLAVLVCEIFAANVATIGEHVGAFLLILAAVFTFFVITYALGEGVSRVLRLPYPEHALLTMTIAARNAPLMLVLTMVALPDQPLVYAAVVIGMLVEFPHLTALTHLLLRRRLGALSGEPPGVRSGSRRR